MYFFNDICEETIINRLIKALQSFNLFICALILSKHDVQQI